MELAQRTFDSVLICAKCALSRVRGKYTNDTKGRYLGCVSILVSNQCRGGLGAPSYILHKSDGRAVRFLGRKGEALFIRCVGENHVVRDFIRSGGAVVANVLGRRRGR